MGNGCKLPLIGEKVYRNLEVRMSHLGFSCSGSLRHSKLRRKRRVDSDFSNRKIRNQMMQKLLAVSK